MFKVADELTFTHDVKVLTPADGGHAEDVLKTTFRFLPSDELAAFDLTRADDTTAYLKAIVVAFHDLVADNGAPLAYSEELRDKLLRRPDVRKALGNHYLAAVAKAPEGN
ncbi:MULTISPECIES: hypothetical protein [unclassified Bradyrhizobium]|uniref:hypothetical protein n=1 Tax=unclassified Bradyrhizobium TaxID=2631580 RepID=UPI00211DF2CD|nr:MULTISPECIES: hypothetical protein [unclassified Bradyrhizobium]MDD1534561.1 hypothetical protein [Bradyrhizobium sp. WBOS8]MDD1581425.1 hypothetical protein [Bradyrhizobium sp. WBOS4]UUO49714.1 hypothetical protein DCM78_24070 [Bradyrhizobium sp. WBOS04]UUO58479.1 hypothetical protein DCM80_04345 [Bradyrhizobium sp. WBOS08]